MEHNEVARQLAQHYGLMPEQASMKAIGNGHINTTMLLKDKNKMLVVQKLNTRVFPKPEQLVDNARAIEAHLLDKLRVGEYELELIQHQQAENGRYLLNLDGEFWRGLAFIGNSYSEDVVANEHQAYTAANAFGAFANALNDFDASKLHHVIPNFHNLAMRIDAFNQVVAEDKHGRVKNCEALIAFCQLQFSLVAELAKVEKRLPVRACHNDTKINNMLFCTKNNIARAVIDLDTCMPGYWLYDFGDMVRTFCSPEAEDSTNLENVQVREEIFSALAKGYIEPLRGVLCEAERESFLLGAKVMPFMIGLRFLTDYLDGDNYFAIHRPAHNLQRAQNQFALYRSVLDKADVLSAIIRSV
ncbi:phosphotransferase enzyme family protein [Pseudoalteromonas sp. T1lg65]|uniref:phosphotransferase enzyme family protein n=1 Tax=Pseudoalteromonas sp. T1lg65 TaxID=2077101 RepID=UPI003F7A95AC